MCLREIVTVFAVTISVLPLNLVQSLLELDRFG